MNGLIVLVAILLAGAPAAEPGNSNPVEASPRQPVVENWAEEARRLRHSVPEVREGPTRAGPAPRSTTMTDDLDQLASRVMEAGSGHASARVLIHLHHSAKRIARAQPGTMPLDTRPWLDRALALLSPAESTALRGHVRLERALLAEEAGDVSGAFEGGRQAAFDAAASNHETTLYRARWLIGRLHRQSGDDEAALRALRHAVGTLEAMKADLVARAAEDALSFRIDVEPVYRALADLLLEDASRSSADPDRRQALLREARDTTERSREAELRDYYQDECLVEPRQPEPAVLSGSVLVHPIVLDDRISLIVERDGTLSQHEVSISPQELGELVAKLRRDLENRTNRRYVRPAAALYDALIRPIEVRLDDAPVEALVFFPGETLRQIPFGALWNATSQRFLVQEYALAVAPSLALTDPRPIPSATARLLVSGLTQSVQGFAPLPNVAREIDAISKFFPSRTLVDEEFGSASVEAAIREVPYAVVHVASHAQFSGDPSESFILTWDGRLPLDRLAEIFERTRFRVDQPIELLVLSACETAMGDERSSLGLAGAALRMGARSVVGTLWSVNDEASARLMTRFYRTLASPDTSRAAALRQAQIDLIADPSYAHPANWAAFLLISNWL